MDYLNGAILIQIFEIIFGIQKNYILLLVIYQNIMMTLSPITFFFLFSEIIKINHATIPICVFFINGHRIIILLKVCVKEVSKSAVFLTSQKDVILQ